MQTAAHRDTGSHGGGGQGKVIPSSAPSSSISASTSHAATSSGRLSSSIGAPAATASHPRLSSTETVAPSPAPSGELTNPTIVRHRGGTPAIKLGENEDSRGDLIGWTEFVHLDGSSYYWHDDKRIITPDDIHKPGLASAIICYVNDTRHKMEAAGAILHGYFKGWEETVVKGVGGEAQPEIYYLDHYRGWFIEPVPHDKTRLISSRLADQTPFDIAYEQRTERYWKEVEAFPMHLTKLPTYAEEEFLGALAYGASERITEWRETPFPLSEHQAERLLQVYEDLFTAAKDDLKVVPAQAWHIARVMQKIEESRRRHKHGTREAKIYRFVAIDAPSWQVKVADMCLAFLLFGVQRMYRHRLQSARVKGVVHTAGLKELIENFLDEWSDSNLLATVFIGANIGFLAVSGINSLQRTALLVSSTFAVMSVVSGVHHIWQHRTKVDVSAEEANNYLMHAHPLGEKMDLAVTACFLAIPVAALLWSIVAFAVALGAFCIQNTDIQGEILLSVALGLLIMLSIATLLFFWHIWRGPRREEIDEEDSGAITSSGWKSAWRRHVKEVKTILHLKVEPDRRSIDLESLY